MALKISLGANVILFLAAAALFVRCVVLELRLDPPYSGPPPAYRGKVSNQHGLAAADELRGPPLSGPSRRFDFRLECEDLDLRLVR